MNDDDMALLRLIDDTRAELDDLVRLINEFLVANGHPPIDPTGRVIT